MYICPLHDIFAMVAIVSALRTSGSVNGSGLASSESARSHSLCHISWKRLTSDWRALTLQCGRSSVSSDTTTESSMSHWQAIGSSFHSASMKSLMDALFSSKHLPERRSLGGVAPGGIR